MVDRYYGFNIKYGLCSFKRYPFIPEEHILESLLREIERYGLPTECLEVLRIIWNSRFWEKKGYDSSTGVKDNYEPRLAPFFHDGMYILGYANRKADCIFKEILKLTGANIWRYNRDYAGVRLFGSIFRLKHLLNGNIKYNFDFDELYYKLKQDKK